MGRHPARVPAQWPRSVALAGGRLRLPLGQDRDRLTAVASYYEAFGTRATLRARLRQVLDTRTLAVEPPPLHRLLADIPVPLLIVTTNLDALAQRAFVAADRPYDLVVYPADRRDLGNAVLCGRTGPPSPPRRPPTSSTSILSPLPRSSRCTGASCPTPTPGTATWSRRRTMSSSSPGFPARRRYPRCSPPTSTTAASSSSASVCATGTCAPCCAP